MKILLAILLVFLNANAQTITDDLLSAQDQLAGGHTFFQNSIIDSREQLSGFIESDIRQLLDSHLDAYAEIKTVALETTAVIDSLEVNERSEACLTAIRRRWETQISRYGRALSNCISTPFRSLLLKKKPHFIALKKTFFISGFSAWNNFLLDIHTRSQLTSNQVQNSGVTVLSETTIFDGLDSFPDMIDNRFHDITFRILPYEETYKQFFDDIESNSPDAIQRLTQCDR